MKYKKKPVIVDAEQWFPGKLTGVVFRPGEPDTPNSFKDEEGIDRLFEGDLGYVRTREGGHIATPGDWIITGIKGEKYPCKPDIFEMTYEKVEE